MDNKEIKDQINCPECNNKIDKDVFYCPICGKKIREKPANMDTLHVAWLFFLSAFLPPFNLSLAQKYVKSPDPKAKRIGWISIWVMVASLVLVLIWGIKWAQDVNRQVNAEMDKYLGF